MSTVNALLDDLSVKADQAKTFIGDFLFAPFGIESTDLVNSITLYAILGMTAVVAYKIASPAPRARRMRNEYLYGRHL